MRLRIAARWSAEGYSRIYSVGEQEIGSYDVLNDHDCFELCLPIGRVPRTLHTNTEDEAKRVIMDVADVLFAKALPYIEIIRPGHGDAPETFAKAIEEALDQ